MGQDGVAYTYEALAEYYKGPLVCKRSVVTVSAGAAAEARPFADNSYSHLVSLFVGFVRCSFWFSFEFQVSRRNGSCACTCGFADSQPQL